LQAATFPFFQYDEHDMKPISISKICISTLCLATLVACGGGGGDDPAPQQTGPVLVTKAQVEDVVKLGVASTLHANSATSSDFLILANVLNSLGDDPDEDSTAEAECTAGGGKAVIDKSGTHTGMAAGDSITITYDKCAVSGQVLNGVVKITALKAVSTADADKFAVMFDSDMTDLTATDGTVTYKYNGSATVNVNVNYTADTQLDGAFSIAAGKSLALEISGGVTTFTLTYGAGTQFTGTQSTAQTTQKLDGNVAVVTKTGTDNITVATPTALTGTLSKTGSFTPASGVINITSTPRRIATSSTITNLGVKMSSGSMDFTTLWSLLLL
jgi:hypothetical protein